MGCGGSTEVESEEDDAALAGTEGDWEILGTGVAHRAIEGGGKNVLAVYGGYTARDEYVRGWAEALLDAKGSTLGIGHVYAVRGPNQSGYANREIGNSKLVAHLAANDRARDASSIIVVAHSSGAFVAAELYEMLKSGRAGSDTLAKVSAFNLDGGGGVPKSTLDAMARAHFVYACDARINRCSRNAEVMKSLGATHAASGGAIRVRADGSGCDRNVSGGTWCLHDTLINTRPHNPAMYDLRRDYTNFTGGREVVTSYLDVIP